MKKLVKWAVFTIGAIWLLWAMAAEAPGELMPATTARLLEVLQNVTPTPTRTPAATPIRTATPRPAATPTTMPAVPTRSAPAVALCQDALQLRRRLLDSWDPEFAAGWGSKSSEEVRKFAAFMSDEYKKSQQSRDLESAAQLSALASATEQVERYCGQ